VKNFYRGKKFPAEFPGQGIRRLRNREDQRQAGIPQKVTAEGQKPSGCFVKSG